MTSESICADLSLKDSVPTIFVAISLEPHSHCASLVTVSTTVNNNTSQAPRHQTNSPSLSSSSSTGGSDSAIGISASSTSSLSPSPPTNPSSTSAIDHLPTHLRIGHSFVALGNASGDDEKERAQNVFNNELVEVERVLERLEKIQNEANAIKGRVLVVAPDVEMRQLLYPILAAQFKDSADSCISGVNAGCRAPCLQVPALFHQFMPIHLPSEICAKPMEERLLYIANNSIKGQENTSTFTERLETINQRYSATICLDSSVDSSLVVRARGLPWQATDQDVALFFAGLNISPGGIAFCLSAEGRRNGEAIVRFDSVEHRDMALQRHRKFLHSRYIEVYRASGDEFVRMAFGVDSEARRFASRDAAMIVRMRGLPFNTTEQQIRDFFASDSDQSNGGIVEPGGILFVNRLDGRPSGDAFVLFVDEVAGRKALTKHKNRIGRRYIELFRTTQAEVQQLFNRTRQRSSPPQNPQSIGISTNGNSTVSPKLRDCIRLRGLPYEAQVQHVVDFLGPHSKSIMYQGVHMIFNNQGHPSGEAFIQMDSEVNAAIAAQQMHNKYMEMGKKKRYIEVFQCSAEDMNNLLLSAVPLLAAAQGVNQPSPPALFGNGLMPLGLPPCHIALQHSAAGLLPIGIFQNHHPSSAANGSLFNGQMVVPALFPPPPFSLNGAESSAPPFAGTNAGAQFHTVHTPFFSQLDPNAVPFQMMQSSELIRQHSAITHFLPGVPPPTILPPGVMTNPVPYC